MTTRNKHQYAENYRRAFPQPMAYRNDDGQIVLPITCAFCNERFVALRRSFMGTGRKCPKCGALHRGSDYTAVPLLTWINAKINRYLRQSTTHTVHEVQDVEQQDTAA